MIYGGKLKKKYRHVLDLYCVGLSNAAPFCENYAKPYFDAKHLEKGLNRGRGGKGGREGGEGEIFGALFSKRCSFLNFYNMPSIEV